MKNKKLISVLLIVLCLSLCVGATYAYFTDSVTSRGNKIQAGNLKIDLELLNKETQEWNSIKTSQAPIFNYNLWEPGYTDVKLLKVENEGNLAIKWEAKLVYDGTIPALAQAIEVYVKASETEFAYPATRAELDASWENVGNLEYFFNNISTILNGELLATESVYFGIELYMPTTVEDNTLQDQTIGEFDIQIVATQYTYESDAFDEKYDEDAGFPCEHKQTVTIPGYAADCQNTGLTDGKKCADCDAVIVAQVETPLAEHTESDWIIDTPAAEGVEGSKHTECTDCHVTITTENIPALPTSIFRFADNGDGTYTVAGLKTGVTAPENLVIPSTYNGRPVTAIGNGAFSYCDAITSVIIPEGVITIGDSVFYDCDGLTEITFPNGVTTIGSWAFRGCSNLQSVSIPNSITSIGASFYYCPNLVYYEYDNAYYLGNPANECLVLMDVKDSSIESFTFNENTKIIFAEAFAGCNLQSITIPDTITNIGWFSFNRCENMTSIIVPNDTIIFADNPFQSCYSLVIYCRAESAPSHWNLNWNCRKDNCEPSDRHEFIPVIWGWTGEQEESIESDDSIFTWLLNEDGISYTVVGLKDGVYSTDIVIPSIYNDLPVTAIGNYAFYNCSGLKSVTIPNSVTTIGINPFLGCANLTSIVVDSENPAYQSIDANLYSKDGTVLIAYAIGKNDTSFTIPDSVTIIGKSAFRGCSKLTSVIIPYGITTISDSAFYGCSGLTSIIIPDTVTTIGNEAFRGCYRLAGELIIPNEITTIGYGTFYDCSGLTSITIHDNVTVIGDLSFYGCSGLTSITIPDRVTTIGQGAFGFCYGLTGELTIPNNVTAIGMNAFSSSKFTKITIGNSVTTIGERAFTGCYNLVEIAISNSITTIGDYAFFYSSNLESITFDGTIEQWDNITFGSDWNFGVPPTEVVCSDGSVALN